MKFLKPLALIFILASILSFFPMNLLAGESTHSPIQNPTERILFHCLVGSGMSGILFEIIETKDSSGNPSILIKENDHPQTGDQQTMIVGTLINPSIQETTTTFSAYSASPFGQISGLIFAEKSPSSELWFIAGYIVNQDRSINDFKNLMNIFGCNKLF